MKPISILSFLCLIFVISSSSIMAIDSSNVAVNQIVPYSNSLLQLTGSNGYGINITNDGNVFSYGNITSPNFIGSGSLLTGVALGSGTQNSVALWSATNTLSSSIIFQQSNQIGVNTATPSFTLDVNGSQRINGNLNIIGNLSVSSGDIYLATATEINGSTNPVLDATFNIGNSTLRWADLWLSGTLQSGTVPWVRLSGVPDSQYANVTLVQSSLVSLVNNVTSLNNVSISQVQTLVDANGNYSADKAGLYANISAASGGTNYYSNISNLQISNQSIWGNFTVIYSNVSVIQTSLGTLVNNLSSVGNYSRDQAGLYANISSASGGTNYYVNITGLQTSNTTTNSRIDSQYINLSGLQTSNASMSGRVDGIYQNVTILQSSMASEVLNRTSLGNYSKDQSSIYSNITISQSSISTLVSNLSSVGNYSKDQAGLYANISAASGGTNYYSNITNLQTSNQSIWNNFSVAYTNITILQNSVSSLVSNLSSVGNYSKDQAGLYANISATSGGANYYSNITNLQISNQSIWGNFTVIYSNVSVIQTSLGTLVSNLSSVGNYSKDANSIYTNVTISQNSIASLVFNLSSVGNYSKDANSIFVNISNLQLSNTSAWTNINGAYTNMTQLQSSIASEVLNRTSLGNYSKDANAIYVNISNLQISNQSIWNNFSGAVNNISSINSSLQTLSTFAQTKGATGNCPTGQFAQNITNTTVQCYTPASSGLSDGSKGDIVVSQSGAIFTIGNSSVNSSKLNTTNSGIAGQVLSLSTGGQFTWLTVGGLGTVTSVDATTSGEGFTVSGNPVTAAGTLAFTLSKATATTSGYLNSSDWATFNGAVDTITSTSAGITIQNGSQTNVTLNDTYVFNIEAQPQNTIYKKVYDFESTTAGYTTIWVPTAISSGTAPVLASSITDKNHPGIINITVASGTVGSGYAFQQSNPNSIALNNNYYTTSVFYPECQGTFTANVSESRIGFQDVYVATAVTDGLFWNISQNSTTTFNATLVAVNNSIATQGTTYTIPCNAWYRATIYVNSITSATGTLYDSTLTVLNTQTVSSNIPTSSGRETASGVVNYMKGARYTNLGIIAYDYFEIGVNASLVR